MNNEYVAETLGTVIKAALRVTGQLGHVVTDNGVDSLYVFEYNGEPVDLECDTNGVIVIKLVEGNQKTSTISGGRTIPCTYFHVWYPKYDNGDTEVGLWPYWYTDDTDEPDAIFKYVEAVGEEVGLHFARINIAYAMEADLRHLEHERAIALDDSEIFS